MMQNGEKPGQERNVDALLSTPDLAGALESEQFRRFLDQVPIAIVVSEMNPEERIVYANPEFERVSGQLAGALVTKTWDALLGHEEEIGDEQKKGASRALGRAVTVSSDYIGTFIIEGEEGRSVSAEAYSNVIENEDGTPCYRFVALVEVAPHRVQQRDELEKQVRDKDVLLREIQHRVKNNLQMIAALLRIEARNAENRAEPGLFSRLAGRIEAIKILYSLLDERGSGDEIDLGVYLGEIATAAMRSYAVEGVRLDLKVDAYTVSVNVAMPAGLVVNELLTNALKHAFAGRDGGTITLHSLTDGNGCRVIVADDGNGLPEGVEWPRRGKLSSLIVRSLRENAKAGFDVESAPGRGMRVTIAFTRASAAPEQPGNGSAGGN
jgi:two-component sensor histidine kinase